jgi:hypothetical protein
MLQKVSTEFTRVKPGDTEFKGAGLRGSGGHSLEVKREIRRVQA